jgi:hypothetical protein
MATTNLATYSAEDYNVPGAGQAGGILSTYQQEIADAQTKQQEIATAAKLQVLGDRQKRAQNAIEVYGTTLGNMYEGDRAAVEFMRKHIEDKFNSGGYENDPGEYARAIAQLDNMSTNFSKFYTESYGTDGADGKGTTYKDMEYNQKMGIANPFEADGMMYNQENDPFDQAGKTLTYMNSGGYAPNSLRINEEGVLVGREIEYNEEGKLIAGEELPLDQLKHRQLGNQAFMPDLVPMDKSIMALTEEHKTGITSYQQRRKPGTNRYYTYDEANELYFADQVKNPGFAQTLLRGQFDEKEIATYVGALNKGVEDVSKNPIHHALFGGESLDDEGGQGTSSERQLGLIDEWKDAGDWSKFEQTDPPITMRHNISSSYQIGEDLEGGTIGPVEEVAISYDVEAQQIEAFTIPGGDHTASDVDYEINGISTDHNGNVYASVVTPVEFIEKSDGTRELYESEEQLEKIRNKDTGAEVVTQDRNKFILVSGDGVEDPRAQEIYDNLVRKGYQGTFIDMQARSLESYKKSKANALEAYEKSKLQSTELSGVKPEEDQDDDDDDGASNIGGGGGGQVTTTSVSGGGGGSVIEDVITGATDVAVNTQGSTTTPETLAERQNRLLGESTKFDPTITYSQVPEEFSKQVEGMHGEELDKAMAARYNDDELIKKTSEETYELPDGTTVREGSADYLVAHTLYDRQYAAREDFKKRKELQRQEDEAIELESQGLNPDAEGTSYTTIEDILREPTETKTKEQQKREDQMSAMEIAKVETTKFWSDLEEKTGGDPKKFWGTPYANEEELFKGDGINTITDNETLRQAIEQYGNPPSGSLYRKLAENMKVVSLHDGKEFQIAMNQEEVDKLLKADPDAEVTNLLRGASSLAVRVTENRIAGKEGYKENGIQMNVPHVGQSGITIAGLDLGRKGGNVKKKLEILAKYLPKDVMEKLTSATSKQLTYRDENKNIVDTNKNGIADVVEAMNNAGFDDYLIEGKTEEYDFGLTQKQLNEITALYADEVINAYYPKIGKNSKEGEKLFLALPEYLQDGLLDIEFNVPTSGDDGSAGAALETALVSDKFEDWEKALHTYRIYFKFKKDTPELEARIAAGEVGDHNISRSEHAADQIEKYMEENFPEEFKKWEKERMEALLKESETNI